MHRTKINMEPTSGTHFSATCALPHWKAGCLAWVKTIESLCSNFDYFDAPWEFLEVTNSAILAGALTQGGVPAMPETYVMRKSAEEWGKRADICLVTRKSNITIVEMVECKLTEYDVLHDVTILSIQKKLKMAHQDVESISGIHDIKITKLPPRVRVKRTGVVIGLPYFEQGTPLSVMKDGVQQVIKELNAASFLDIAAWCFPEQYLGAPSKHWPDKLYPGTFLTIQAVSNHKNAL